MTETTPAVERSGMALKELLRMLDFPIPAEFAKGAGSRELQTKSLGMNEKMCASYARSSHRILLRSTPSK
jgi:hypothetical protein